MSRPLRIQFEGAYYHIASRGNERRAIFRDDDDRALFVEMLARSLETHRVRLLCYVLMDNHYHLLVQTLNANLSQFMMHLNGGYTNAFNRRRRRSGHLLQGRYHAVVVERDSYLLEVSRYLHLNPVRVKAVVEKSASEKDALLLRNRWSSYRGYVSVRQREPFVDYADILDFFGGDSPHGRRGYAHFVREGVNGECRNPFAQLMGNVALGGEEFAARIRSSVLAEREEKRERPAVRALAYAHDPQEVLMVVSRLFGVKPEELAAKGRRTAVRGMAMELMRRYCGLTQPQIGNLFGDIDYSTVSVERSRFLRQVEHDAQLRDAFAQISRELSPFCKE